MPEGSCLINLKCPAHESFMKEKLKLPTQRQKSLGKQAQQEHSLVKDFQLKHFPSSCVKVMLNNCPLVSKNKQEYCRSEHKLHDVIHL